MYHIQLMLTKKCNQSCFYCSTHAKDGTEVDIDYLNYVLDFMPDETGVEITGGEIGLIENIDEVYRTVKKHKNIMHIKVLSNGLIRLKGVDWLKDVEYWEHLIHEIDGKRIIKFYDELDLDQDHTYVIVTTKNTIRSLMDNWQYFDDMGMFKENFFYKLMNHKSQYTIDAYYDDLFKFYGSINNTYFQKMLIHWKLNTYLNFQKCLCKKFSPNLYVDFQTKEIGHCAMNVNLTTKVEFNKNNLDYMMKGYYNDPCCEKCYSFDHGSGRSMLNNRSYK